ncbi:hypothetical protein EIN_488090 [Entamoeba invadens IP1]|uniref:Vacuolar protein sorting-associated protein VTA1 n=2 Tax=Entamoeba invadens TaxID=33085 RepID=A0A0A1U4U1_ENTIV|nr:hypothetical protein EIN_488090 [Entamoeba invadens IP1]ELP89287.1 hypothetical protein EIN_488090 [Entamoeba invadens IP1]BAN40899.1 hypothetical protein [Entamoeba invadens]|eukprot:XP_004256058.1 hypothetical protein EIN_488090 [Entamoeba invadens IP1]
MNIDQFPPTVKTWVKVSQSFEKTDSIISFHCIVKAKAIIDQTIKSDEEKQNYLNVLDVFQKKAEATPQFIAFKETEKSPAEYLYKKAVALLQSTDKTLKQTGPSPDLSKMFLVVSCLLELYELFFPLNETSKKMQLYAKVKAAECAKTQQTPQTAQLAQAVPNLETTTQIVENEKKNPIHYITEEKPIDKPVAEQTEEKFPSQFVQPIKTVQTQQKVPEPVTLPRVQENTPEQDISKLSLFEKQTLAEKYVQSALSSLDFQDATTAVKYMRAALEMLA